MLRLHVSVGAAEHSLKQAPEVLNAVCVNFTLHVFDGMVYPLVLVLFGESHIAPVRVGEDFRARFNMCIEFRSQSSVCSVGNDLRPNPGWFGFSAALQDTHDDLFTSATASGLALLRFMLVLLKSADKGFVSFHGTAGLFKATDLDGVTDA